MGIKGAICGGIAEELFGLKDIDVENNLQQYLEPYLFGIAYDTI